MSRWLEVKLSSKYRQLPNLKTSSMDGQVCWVFFSVCGVAQPPVVIHGWSDVLVFPLYEGFLNLKMSYMDDQVYWSFFPVQGVSSGHPWMISCAGVFSLYEGLLNPHWSAMDDQMWCFFSVYEEISNLKNVIHGWSDVMVFSLYKRLPKLQWTSMSMMSPRSSPRSSLPGPSPWTAVSSWHI